MTQLSAAVHGFTETHGGADMSTSSVRHQTDVIVRRLDEVGRAALHKRASVSKNVSCVATNLRLRFPSVSANVRRIRPVIVRQASHYCASLQLPTTLRRRRRAVPKQASAANYTSTAASNAFSWMNSRRGSTRSPIRRENMSSASSAWATRTCSRVRALESSVVSQSCSAFISPSPL
jgi:hypothetical protein